MKHACIYSAVRTPIGKFNGAFADISAPELGAVAIREALKRSGVSADALGGVLMGNAIAAGLGQAPARQAAMRSGLDERIGAATVNRVCGSALQAVIFADQAIALGEAEFMIAGGMENMSRAPYLLPQLRAGHKLGNTQAIDSMIHDGLLDAHERQHMGELTDALAAKNCISRESQDAYAIASYTRARAAVEKGIFAKETVPVPRTLRSGETEWIENDEQPYAEELDRFPFLRPVFVPETGTLTKGNGAKINDGAAALVLGKESAKYKPIARIVGYASHSQSPATFAIAPVQAIEKVLKKCNLSVEDIDLFEINEAFAAASLIVNERLQLNPEKVNVHGGAIALGHPIGATGARILVTLLNALKQKNRKRGVASLCIGGGEALALIVETA